MYFLPSMCRAVNLPPVRLTSVYKVRSWHSCHGLECHVDGNIECERDPEPEPDLTCSDQSSLSHSHSSLVRDMEHLHSEYLAMYCSNQAYPASLL